MSDASSPRQSTWQPLALAILGVAAVAVLVVRLIPYEHRMLNFTPVGAMFLYAGARLRPGWIWLAPFGVLVAIDIYFLGVKQWRPSPFVYISYILYVMLGWRLLSRSESPVRTGGAILGGSMLFFLLSNFGVWLQHVVQPDLFVAAPFQFAPTLSGLLHCYEAALEYFRGTILGDALFTSLFFGAHAILARMYFPAERITPVTLEIRA